MEHAILFDSITAFNNTKAPHAEFMQSVIHEAMRHEKRVEGQGLKTIILEKPNGDCDILILKMI